MALSPRVQASLDRYLASFTPDISSQIDDLGSLADDIGDISKDYVAALDNIQEANKEMVEKIEALMKLEFRLDDNGRPTREPFTDTDRLAALREIIEDYCGELSGIFSDAPGPAWNSHLQPLEVAIEQINTVSDELSGAARALDECAGRIGRIA